MYKKVDSTYPRKYRPISPQQEEKKKWDEVNFRKNDSIAWNGSHSDAASILSSLINVGVYKDLTQETIKELFDKWQTYFYDRDRKSVV